MEQLGLVARAKVLDNPAVNDLDGSVVERSREVVQYLEARGRGQFGGLCQLCRRHNAGQDADHRVVTNDNRNHLQIVKPYRPSVIVLIITYIYIKSKVFRGVLSVCGHGIIRAHYGSNYCSATIRR